MSRLRFSAVVGQEAAKQALMMAAVQPLLGGVLLRGDKGSAKTTLARGVAAFLPASAHFVEVPLGATEERVIGSLDLTELLVNGRPRFRPGLLAAAHGGVLYVDEVNLLADHLIDALLDVAVSGVNRIERDGLSHSHPARFILVASMDPHEGELRPQLLDRFGLAVDVTAVSDISMRTEAVRRQLALERGAGDQEYAYDDEQLRKQLAAAQGTVVEIGDEVVELASRLAVAVGAEGLRADLMLCRAAMATAVLDGRAEAKADDVRDVAEMVLGHRRRRRPFDKPGISADELDQAWRQAILPRDSSPDSRDDVIDLLESVDVDVDTDIETDIEPAAGDEPGDEADVQLNETTDDDADASPDTHVDEELDQLDDAVEEDSDADDSIDGEDTATKRLFSRRPPRGSQRSNDDQDPGGARGARVRDAPYDPAVGGPVDAMATAMALASRRVGVGSPTAPVAVDDLRRVERQQRGGTLLVLVVDAAASAGAKYRMGSTKAAVLGLIGDAHRRRGRIALITFRGDGAELILPPTASIETARAQLSDMRTGGKSPLFAGLDEALSVVSSATAEDAVESTVVVVTDGRATAGGDDPLTEAARSLDRLAATGARVVFLDTETGNNKLGQVAQLASSVGAEWLPLDISVRDGLETMVRSLYD
jgi:magnesium chelatase subunit D